MLLGTSEKYLRYTEYSEQNILCEDQCLQRAACQFRTHFRIYLHPPQILIYEAEGILGKKQSCRAHLKAH